MTSAHPGGPRRALVTGLVVALTATPALVACSGDEQDVRRSGQGAARGTDRADGDAGRGSARPRVRTVVEVGEVAGALPPATRRTVATKVGRTVDRWWDAAFVDLSYPRTRYRGAFPGFTAGAARSARRDLDRTTSHRLGERIESLTPVRRRVVVDILATARTPRAVTARAILDFRTGGEVQRRVRVTARLFMLDRRSWTIFGYDVEQGRWPVDIARAQQDRGTRGQDRSRS